MNKKAFIFTCFMFLVVAIFASNLTVIFEPYSVFSYMEDFTVKGLAVDIVKGISEEIDGEIDVEFTQWDEAYSRLQNGSNVALAAMAMNAERKDQFKWAGPISIIKTNIYAKATDYLFFETLEDAKKAKKICVVKDYYSTQYLQEKGFDNLAVYPNETEAFKAFVSNENYLFTTDNVSLSILMKDSVVGLPKMESLLTYSMDYIYMGFSKDVDAERVQSWQNGLDTMKENGQLDAIYKKWLPGTKAPGKYSFVA